MLIKTHRQESLSRVFIHAIAARCGLNCTFKREFDYGIDATVYEIARRNGRYVETGFNIDIQAKSTINAIFEADHVKYDLEVKNYNDLRETVVGTPRILVVLVMPADELQWTAMTEDQLLLRRCAYWMSLKGQSPTPNRDTIRVSIPRANAFTIEALKGLMAKRRAGDDL